MGYGWYLGAGRRAPVGGGSTPSEGGAKPGASHWWWLLSLWSPAQPPGVRILQPLQVCVTSLDLGFFHQ